MKRDHSESRKTPSSRLLEAETKKESREEGGRQAQDREEECKCTEEKREKGKSSGHVTKAGRDGGKSLLHASRTME